MRRRVSHYHVWKLQEPERGKFAFHREDEIHLSRATASRKRAAPDDIVRVCYAADGRPAPLGSLLPQAEREKHSTRNPPTTSRGGPTQPILHFVHYTVYIFPS